MSEAEGNAVGTEESKDEVLLEVEGELASIFLGGTSNSVVVLNDKRIFSLRNAIREVASNSGIKALIIFGGSEKIFCAGADINGIRAVYDPKDGEELALLGQEVFNELEALKCTTVAAISGACVGGGCELVLACDYRVATDISQTKIGLPEVKLGIVPGFGGTQRLPRLIGLPRALDIILQGKTLGADKAYKVGLVDKIVNCNLSGVTPTAALESVARDVALGNVKINRPNLPLRDRLLSFNPIGRSVVKSQALKSVLKETKGKYPAPPKALEVACAGLALSLKEGLKLEAKALGETVVTPESKSLVHLFFLTEAAGKLGKAAKEDLRNAHVVVIGGGVMGAGIASSLLSRGFRVSVVELAEAAREKAKGHIESFINKRRNFSDSEKAKLLANLALGDDLGIAKDAILVVEAIVEDLKVKKELFSKLAQVISEDCILASNTSSLPITDMAEGIKNPERVLGMHFFNPAEKMPLVEIIRGVKTSDKSVVQTAAVTSKLGKFPVVAEDVRGFLVNRLLSPYLSEAAHLLKDGVPVSIIDKVATDFGMPMGPVRLLDEIGLDVAAKVAKIMIDAYGERMQGPRYAEQMVSLGRLGKKNGKGFYVFNGKEATLAGDLDKLLELPPMKQESEIDKKEVEDRLILSMVNEAVKCLDEGVAGIPGKDSAGQVDLATVMGTGFAPFRGGVLFYAEKRGIKDVSNRLKTLEKKYGKRFAPAKGIVERAKDSKSFYV